jgi:DNA-binding NtrC family response regulator
MTTKLSVLVVDDEPEVRKLVGAIIGMLGYTVLTADSGEHALALYQNQGVHLDLLVADVVSNGMSGPALAERMCALQPGLKVLFMSGYDHTHVVQSYVLDRGCTLIAKPFTASQLSNLVRALVTGTQQARAAG